MTVKPCWRTANATPRNLSKSEPERIVTLRLGKQSQPDAGMDEPLVAISSELVRMFPKEEKVRWWATWKTWNVQDSGTTEYSKSLTIVHRPVKGV